MSTIALLTILWGFWHKHELEGDELKCCVGSGGLYLTFGLLYLNLSLWILSLDRGALEWILVLTSVCIAQVVAGARFKDGRFTGFGIVFLSIDLYTRFYEHFWDSLSKATFFAVTGAAAMALGYIFEHQVKKASTI